MILGLAPLLWATLWCYSAIEFWQKLCDLWGSDVVEGSYNDDGDDVGKEMECEYNKDKTQKEKEKSLTKGKII